MRMLEKMAAAIDDSQYTTDITSTLSMLLLDKISSIFLWRSTLIFLSPMSILLFGDIFKLILFDGNWVGPTQFSGVFHPFILKVQVCSMIDKCITRAIVVYMQVMLLDYIETNIINQVNRKPTLKVEFIMFKVLRYPINTLINPSWFWQQYIFPSFLIIDLVLICYLRGF